MPTGSGNRKRYTQEDKREILAALSLGQMVKEVCERYDVTRRTLSRWRKKVEGQRMKGSSDKVVASDRENEQKKYAQKSLKYKSLKEAAIFFGVSLNQLKHWRRKHGIIEQLKIQQRRKNEDILKISLSAENDFEAAKKAGVAPHKAQKIRLQGGFVRVHRPETHEKDIIVKRSQEYESCTEAAKELGVPYGSLGKWRRERGVRRKVDCCMILTLRKRLRN